MLSTMPVCRDIETNIRGLQRAAVGASPVLDPVCQNRLLRLPGCRKSIPAPHQLGSRPTYILEPALSCGKLHMFKKFTLEDVGTQNQVKSSIQRGVRGK